MLRFLHLGFCMLQNLFFKNISFRDTTLLSQPNSHFGKNITEVVVVTPTNQRYYDSSIRYRYYDPTLTTDGSHGSQLADG